MHESNVASFDVSLGAGKSPPRYHQRLWGSVAVKVSRVTGMDGLWRASGFHWQRVCQLLAQQKTIVVVVQCTAELAPHVAIARVKWSESQKWAASGRDNRRGRSDFFSLRCRDNATIGLPLGGTTMNATGIFRWRGAVCIQYIANRTPDRLSAVGRLSIRAKPPYWGLFGPSCQAILYKILSYALLFFTLSAESLAEPLTLGDLAGASVEANIYRRQSLQRNGRAFSIQTHQNWKFEINGDNTIDMTVNTTVQGPRGTRKAPPNSGRFSLEESRDVRSRGGGQGMWSFADNALHFTRTFQSGAYRAHFTFSRGEGAVTCEVTEGFARLDGNKPITLNSAIDGAPVSIIDSKQEPSDCKVRLAQ